jgi:hypothetical protein
VVFDGRIKFEVNSFTSTKTYDVTFGERGWKCTCPRWKETELPCKHIERVARRLDPHRPLAAHEDDPCIRRTTYSQDWPAYDAAQQAEHTMFDALLWDLLEQVPERRKPADSFGRPEIPLRVQFLITVKKVHQVDGRVV